jgi:hypothetical protein
MKFETTINPTVSGGDPLSRAMLLAKTGPSTFSDGYLTREGPDRVLRYLQRGGLKVTDMSPFDPACGGYGCVFSFDDDRRWTLKLTSDQTDAAAAAWIMSKPGARRYSAIPDVRAVFALRRMDLFDGCVLRGPLAEDIELGRMRVYGIVLPTLYPIKRGQVETAMGFAEAIQEPAEHASRGVREANNWLKRAGLHDVPQANEFARGVAFLASHGIVVFDMAHIGNVLANDRGDWVLADLGWSSAPSTFVPFLNRVIAAEVLESISRPPKHNRARR